MPHLTIFMLDIAFWRSSIVLDFSYKVGEGFITITWKCQSLSPQRNVLSLYSQAERQNHPSDFCKFIMSQLWLIMDIKTLNETAKQVSNLGPSTKGHDINKEFLQLFLTWFSQSFIHLCTLSWQSSCFAVTVIFEANVMYIVHVHVLQWLLFTSS